MRLQLILDKMSIRVKLILSGLLLIIISFFVFMFSYWTPPAQFWDENYHIASAQKYIDGVMFMESHPPLGKMLIALGEVFFDQNKNIVTREFLNTDYIVTFPNFYSFIGVRFFSSFLGWLATAFFFGIIYNLTNKIYLSFLLTFLYIFNNAFVLQSRSAMLEGIQIFFVFATVYYFTYIVQNKFFFTILDNIILGMLTGFAISTKINSGVLLVIPCILFYFEVVSPKFFYVTILVSSFVKTLLFFTSVFFIFLIVFYIHFSLGKKIIEGKTYNASSEYLRIIEEKKTSSISSFYIMFRDNIEYMIQFQKKVPKLDRNKTEENGSYPTEWILGKKAINFRWNRSANGEVRYLYLFNNPIVLFSGFFGLILSLILFLGRLFFKTPIVNKKIFNLLVVFLLLYFLYMIPVLMQKRVLYLYHYFIPLFFSLFLNILILYYIFEVEIINNDRLFYLGVTIFSITVFIVFLYYSPFVYYKPLSISDFIARDWFNFWELTYVK